MPLTPDSLFDTSHLATFAGGALLGAAGQYLADRFTDVRRNKEAAHAINTAFHEARKRSPKLLAEMSADLKSDIDGFMHEFVILPSNTTSYWPEKKRFAYFKNEHNDLQNQVSLLVHAGLLITVREGHGATPSTYQFTSDFMRLLKDDSVSRKD